MECKSLRHDNQLKIVCPIFVVDVELRGCFRLNEIFMTGRKLPTRRGCQAAMASSKCPVWHIHQRLRRGEDAWHASSPVVRSLNDDLLRRVATTRVLDRHLASYDVEERERELLLASNVAGQARVVSDVHSSRTDAIAKSGDDEITKAARSGDLGAALASALKQGSQMSADGDHALAPAKTRRRRRSPSRVA